MRYSIEFTVRDLGRGLTMNDCRKADTLRAGLLEQVTEDLISWHGVSKRALPRVLDYIELELADMTYSGFMMVEILRESRGGSVVTPVCGIRLGLEAI